MDRALYQRVHDVLSEIADLEPILQQEAARKLCAGDAELQEAVLEMLCAEEHAADSDAFDDRRILEQRASLEVAFDTEQPDAGLSLIPDSIGLYRVIRCLGEGGMGVVYECDQPNPRRRVAVKVVDGFRGSPELQKRLIQEAQIQGRLQHSAIAQVFEAGMATVGGRACPFFAMELIDGRPIVAYSSDKQLDIRGRLELIAKVADGLGRAHASGVVHRDLKPDNVLVEPSGQPKILDFGIARITTEASIAVTAMTRAGQVLGTLAYMAPEQLASDPDSVTPAADIYALGVIAYELLAGRLPNELDGLSMVSAMHLLDTNVPMPIRRFAPSLDRDIETIVMRCLRREPETRYQSADELASDIRRFLADLPIRARPMSRAYRAKKFVKRHRLLVGGVSATLLALTAGTIIATVFAVGQSRARTVAEEQRRFASEKELEAASGVMVGALVLAQKGEPWLARTQLDTVRPELRGWAWNHLSLRLPWVVEGTGRDERRVPWKMAWNTSWVSSREMLWVDTDTGQGRLFDATNNAWTELSNTPPILWLPRWRSPEDGLAMVTLEDKQIGILNVHTETFEPLGTLPADGEQVGPNAVSDDGRSMVWRHYETDYLRVYHDGSPTLLLPSGQTQLPGMNWIKPEFMPGSSTLIAGHWANSQSPASLFAIDAERGVVLGQSRFELRMGPVYGPLSDDRVIGLQRASADIEIRSLPGLELDRVIDLGGLWPDSLAVSQDGSRIATVVGNEFETRTAASIRIIDPLTGRTMIERSIGADRFDRNPVFSPDGSLLAAWAPGSKRLWLVDTNEVDAEGRPAFGPITTLKAHDSWIYQIAVSPDGSLLASAAPEGDILIWDLTLGEMIARLPRFHDKDRPGVLAFNMDAPLLFNAMGNTLVFGEANPETRKAGLTTIDLDTGERTWIHSGSHLGVLDAAATYTQPGVPAPLYHHAAKLADGRILETRASVTTFSGVGIRRPGMTEREIDLFSGRIRSHHGGVAVAPDGRTIAAHLHSAVEIRDVETGAVFREIHDAASTTPYGMAFSNDGSRFAICTKDGRLIVYDTDFYARLLELPVPPPTATSRPYIFSMRWTPDDRRLITTSGSHIRVFESERAVVRSDRRAAWTEDLARARAGESDASESAKRVSRIQTWSRQGP